MTEEIKELATTASATYAIALGDNAAATHRHSMMIGNDLSSIADKHVRIKFGSVEVMDKIATNDELIAIRGALAVLLSPKFDISEINTEAIKDLKEEL